MLEAKEQGAETGKRDRETEEDCLAFVRWGPQESPVHFISSFNAWLPMVFFYVYETEMPLAKGVAMGRI